MRVAPSLTLSAEEREALLRWARTRPIGHGRALRARIILRAAEGARNTEIAQELGVSRLTAARWRDRFSATRLRGVRDDGERLPRRPTITAETVQAIVRASRSPSSGGGPGETTRRLGRRFGVSHMTVHRVWQAYGIVPRRFEALPMRPDPVKPLVAAEVAGLFLHPPDYAVAIVLGESAATSGKVLERAPGALAHAPSPAPGADGPPSPRLGEVLRDLRIDTFARANPAQRATSLLRFLGAVERRVDTSTDVRVLVGGPTAETTPEIARWRVRHPNVRIESVTRSDRWRARALDELHELGRTAAPRPGQAGPAERARSIAGFLEAYPDRGRPFEWTASREEIRSRAAAQQLRYDLAVTGHSGFKSTPRVASGMADRSAAANRDRELARAVLRKSLRVRPGEHVTIESWSETLPAANAFVLEALRLGARPLLLYQDEPTYWAAAAEVRVEYLARLGEHRRAAMEKTDVLVSFFGPSDRERLHAMPRAAALKLGEYRDALYRAAARSGARAVQMAVGRASPASARMYGVDLHRWKEELVAGTLVDPAKLREAGRALARRLEAGRTLLLTHPNGTELRLGLKGRKASVSDGIVPAASAKGNWNLVTLPAGVVNVALDEHVAEGVFRSNVRSSVGVSATVGEVAGGRWTFENGRLVRFTYEEGREFFAPSYERAGPGRERPGTLSIGLNPHISMSPLLEDQGLGTLTLHIGRNDHAGGSTRLPWWAWLFLRDGQLKIDDRTVLDRGRLRP